MSLADTARAIRKDAVSRELQFLRDARRYMKQNTEEQINARGRQLLAYEETPEGQTMEGQNWCVREIAELGKICDTRRLYGEILRFAEKAQRKEGDSGEAFVRRNWELIQRKAAVVEERYQKTMDCQIKPDC